MQRPIIEHQTKPASEWICGRVVRKVSPRERHSRALRQMTIALGEWAEKYGTSRVGPEREFRIAPPSEVRRTLVLDVGYLSYDRVPYEDDDAADMPIIAPNVAIEILSPRDRRQYVDEKIRVYLGRRNRSCDHRRSASTNRCATRSERRCEFGRVGYSDASRASEI